MTPTLRRLRRRQERGATLVVIVLVTTLISGIGVFAVQHMSQVDRAVGLTRQSAQANGLAELGTTAAMAQIVSLGSYYTAQMDLGYTCLANGPYASTLGSTCYRIGQDEIESNTTSHSGVALLEPAGASESGSMGPLANAETKRVISVEMTEKYKTFTPKAGSVQGKATDFDVTLTTTANVRPTSSSADPCGDNVPTVTAKKVLRTHAIVPGQPEGS